MKQLAYENASPACQAAPRPHRRKADIHDFIKVCLDIILAYKQISDGGGLAGTSVQNILFLHRKQGI
ncbi:hypothetical protein ACQP3J_26545, partial [Escherichia coli]